MRIINRRVVINLLTSDVQNRLFRFFDWLISTIDRLSYKPRECGSVLEKLVGLLGKTGLLPINKRIRVSNEYIQ